MDTDYLWDRFIDAEQWRKDFGLDELVHTFDYKEKEDVFKYYPQYYHKTDKVYFPFPFTLSSLYIKYTLSNIDSQTYRMVVQSTSNKWVTST